MREPEVILLNLLVEYIFCGIFRMHCSLWYAAISHNAPHVIPTSYLVLLLFKLIRYCELEREGREGNWFQ